MFERWTEKGLAGYDKAVAGNIATDHIRDCYAEIDRLTGLYEQAVKGRGEFRSALRAARKEAEGRSEYRKENE